MRKHYKATFSEVKQRRGAVATACMVGCMCCGYTVSGMGGPRSDIICQDCIEKMETGEMAEALHLLLVRRETNKEAE